MICNDCEHNPCGIWEIMQPFRDRGCIAVLAVEDKEDVYIIKCSKRQKRRTTMFKNLMLHWMTSLGGVVSAAAGGAALAVYQQGPTKEAAINGAIMGAVAGILGAAGGAAKDPGKP
jgi:hypothetical protein